MAELHLAGVVELEHREIDDPAEAEGVLLQKIELVAQAIAHLARQLRGRQRLVAGEEDRIAVLQAGNRLDLRETLGVEVLGDRSLGAAVLAIDDVAEAGDREASCGGRGWPYV